jgi:uncharacterized protein YidB (DUF937 family)
MQHMTENRQRREAMTPEDIERSLGEERVRWLMSQTGMTRKELLKGLSNASRHRS